LDVEAVDEQHHLPAGIGITHVDVIPYADPNAE
jgi:hypothetical protein